MALLPSLDLRGSRSPRVPVISWPRVLVLSVSVKRKAFGVFKNGKNIVSFCKGFLFFKRAVLVS